jgi:lipopolysaccharide transport system permease protein
MILACFFIAASLVCILRDFSMIIPLGMTFLLFSSGIFWDVHALGDPQKTELVLALNPVAFILDAYRHILMPQTVPDLLHLLQIAVVCFVLILAMAAIMRRSSQFRALKVLSA